MIEFPDNRFRPSGDRRIDEIRESLNAGKKEVVGTMGELKEAGAIGATGNFPSGKLNPDDWGELRIAIAADPKTGNVIIAFGKEVEWLAVDPDQATSIAAMLLQKAHELKSGRSR